MGATYSSLAHAKLWECLDAVMDELMAARKNKHNGDGLAYAKGRALGLATAVAIIEQPLDPDVDAVRERAMERWDERQARIRAT